MISKKKHERFLYILLGLYTVLVLIFMLLLNGFFVKSKAFTDGTNYTISYNLVAYDDATCTTDVKYTWTGNSRYIFYSDSDFKEVLDNVVSGNLNKDVSCSCIRISKTNQDHIIGGSVSSNVVSQIGPYSAAAQQNFAISFDNSTIYNYFKNKGYALDPVAGYPYFVNFVVNGANINGNKVIGGELLSDNVQYIDSPEDLYDYMVNNNDDVVKIGNPDNPPLPEDDSLPVPQSLTLDLKNNENAYPPFLSGSWSNPSSLLASYDASDIQIEVQYKPNFQYYKKIFDIKLDTGQANDWISVNKDTIENFKKWTIVLNNSNNLPPDGDGVYVRSGSDDISLVASQHGISNYSNHVESLNGTKWRCRYIVGNKTSLWVVYGLKSINNFGRPSLSGDEITFENASGDPISAEDVNYNNSSYTEQDYNSLSLLGKIRYDIDNLFTSLKSFFSPQDKGNGFYAFFGRVFEQFPIFWALFVLGLVVAILLRIFGR